MANSGVQGTPGASPPRRRFLLVSAILLISLAGAGLFLWQTGRLAALLSPARPRTLLDFEAAAQEAQDAFEKAPRSLSQVERETLEDRWATALNDVGSYYLQHKLIESAKGRFSKAIEISPDYAAPHYNLAAIYVQESQFDRAIELLKAAVKTKPDHLAALCLLGECYLNSHHDADALQAFQQASDVDPHSVRALNDEGLVFQRRQTFDYAIDRFSKALEIEPANPYVIANLADCKLKFEKWDEAIALYNKAMALQFNPPDFLINLGTAYTGKGQLKKGYDYYIKATGQYGPDNPLLLSLIAANQVEQKDYRTALANFQKALKLEPDFTVARMRMGNLYERMNDLDSAWKEYDTVARSKVLPFEKTSALLARGNVSLRQHRAEEALTTYREVSLLGVNEGQAYLAMARAYHALKDDALTQSYFSAAQKLGMTLEPGDKAILSSIVAAPAGQPRENPSDVIFDDVAKAAGIGFVHFGGFPILHLPQNVPPGVAVVDFDGSGYESLYYTNSADYYRKTLPPIEQQSSRLYRNNGDGTFADVTEPAGLFENHRFGCASIFVDVDNDGYPDLVTTGLGFAEFYRNNGDGTFTEVPGYFPMKFAPGQLVTGPSAGDFDHDGFLDIYFPSYTVVDLEHIPAAPFIYHQPGSLPVPISMRPLDHQAAPKYLLRNRGDGSFEDVTTKAGVGNVITGNERSLQSVFADIDNDGWPDLLVANDVGDFGYWHNEHNGTFKDIARKTWINDVRGNMGIAVGDFEWKGSLDIAVTHWSHDSTGFYRNEYPRKAFTDLVVPLGMAKTNANAQDVGWGTGFFDYDNDGYLDYYWVNGHTQAEKYEPPGCYTTEKNLCVPQRPYLFKGDGKGFVDVSKSTGFSHYAWVSRASAVFDYDHDGALDVAIANNYGPAVLLKNQGHHGHWIDVELVGTRSNRQAVGARVKLQWKGQTHWQEVHLGGSYFGQDTMAAHFGLGDQTTAQGIEVLWPGGKSTQIASLPADRRVRVVEP